MLASKISVKKAFKNKGNTYKLGILTNTRDGSMTEKGGSWEIRVREATRSGWRKGLTPCLLPHSFESAKLTMETDELF